MSIDKYTPTEEEILQAESMMGDTEKEKTARRKKFIEELKKIDFEKKKFIVDKIYLRQSKLSKSGARYSDLMIADSE